MLSIVCVCVELGFRSNQWRVKTMKRVRSLRDRFHCKCQLVRKKKTSSSIENDFCFVFVVALLYIIDPKHYHKTGWQTQSPYEMMCRNTKKKRKFGLIFFGHFLWKWDFWNCVFETNSEHLHLPCMCHSWKISIVLHTVSHTQCERIATWGQLIIVNNVFFIKSFAWD